MKKIGLLAVAVALAFSASPLHAKDKSSAGGLELSGNVDVVTGWQHDGNNVLGLTSFGVNQTDQAAGAVGMGQLGDFRGADFPKRDTFNFYIDQVELDLNKTFGENIRIRADLDFGRPASGTPLGGFNLEQGYVTANIPVGNGVEFLIGRFNAPIGLDSVDRNENLALSFSNIYRYLRPHNVTGAKIYYAFNDLLDWHLYVVNNLADTIGTAAVTDTAIPSFGSRFGLTWGEKGKESTVGLSYAAGPEGIVGGVSAKKHFTHVADLDFSIHVTDAFLIAGEGMYRQDNVGGACVVPGNTTNCKAFAGQLALAYNFNETWSAWFRYGFLNDRQGNYTTSAKGKFHDFSLGAAYQITDGAKLKAEYRLDLQQYTAGLSKGFNNAFALEFAYNF